MKKMLGWRSAAFLTMLSMCGAAHAALSQYTFEATVLESDGSLSGVGVGTKFSGSFSFDPAAAITTTEVVANLGSWQNYLAQAGTVSTNIGGHDVESGLLDLHLLLVDPHVYALMIFGSPVSIDGTRYPSAQFGLEMVTNTSPDAVTGLPTHLGDTTFDGGTFGFIDSAVTNGLGPHVVGFTIDSISAVPEPSTYALLLSGLAVVGASRRRLGRGKGTTC